MAGPADLLMCTGGIVLGFARRSAKILRSVGSWRWRCFHKWLAPLHRSNAAGNFPISA